MKGDVGPRLEYAPDVLAHLPDLRALAGRVVLEHHVRGMHRDGRVEIVRVPRVVVAPDRLPQLDVLGRLRDGQAHSIG